MTVAENLIVQQNHSEVLHARGGLHRRLHAWKSAHLNGRHEQLVANRKRALFGALTGTVLEIGPGTGPNLAYYSPDVRWIGLEPNLYMHPYLHQAAARLGRTVELHSGIAEELPADNDSVDAVVSTMVLCSVDDPARTLQEVLRVLTPGGQFIFIEHVAAPRGTRLRRWQDWASPLWNIISDGCHPNRETWTLIEHADFAQVRYERFQPRGRITAPHKLLGRITAPHISGVAVKKE